MKHESVLHLFLSQFHVVKTLTKTKQLKHYHCAMFIYSVFSVTFAISIIADYLATCIFCLTYHICFWNICDQAAVDIPTFLYSSISIIVLSMADNADILHYIIFLHLWLRLLHITIHLMLFMTLCLTRYRRGHNSWCLSILQPLLNLFLQVYTNLFLCSLLYQRG